VQEGLLTGEVEIIGYSDDQEQIFHMLFFIFHCRIQVGRTTQRPEGPILNSHAR
jgi:hypothetical protein